MGVSVRTGVSAISLLISLGACARISGVGDLRVDDALDAATSPPGDDAGESGDGAAPDQAAPDGSRDAPPPPPPHVCTATSGPALVGLATFCIDATEVTNDQYAAFLGSNPNMSLAPAPACAYATSFIPSSHWPAGSDQGANPVVYVDWCDAYAYCAWAGKHLCGAIAGGPSSKANVANADVDEWTAACSGRGANVFPYGSDTYEPGACNDYEAMKHGSRPVGSFAGCEGGYPGIFDMNGNASEWEDACDGSAGASDACVVRGGSWSSLGSRAGCRTYYNDHPVQRSATSSDTGFRCCDR